MVDAAIVAGSASEAAWGAHADHHAHARSATGCADALTALRRGRRLYQALRRGAGKRAPRVHAGNWSARIWLICRVPTSTWACATPASA